MKPTTPHEKTPYEDPIVEETRAIRATLLRKAGGSIEKLMNQIKDSEKRTRANVVDLGRRASAVVSLPRKKRR